MWPARGPYRGRVFEETLDDFADYYRAQKSASADGFEETAGLEVQRRLRHLDHLLQEVARRQELLQIGLSLNDLDVGAENLEPLVERIQLASEASARELAARGLLGIEVSEQIEMLAESFYFHAHRLLKLLQNGPLPGFGSLQAKGVLLVRNHLVEHFPERDKPWPANHSRDFSDTEAGPKLTKATDPVEDAGLYRNARELRDAISEVLNALPRTPAPSGSPGTFGGTWWREERKRRIAQLRRVEGNAGCGRSSNK